MLVGTRLVPLAAYCWFVSKLLAIVVEPSKLTSFRQNIVILLFTMN